MSQREIIIGIDLGTTYSAMAYVDETGYPKIIENNEGQRTTPSVVFFEEENNVIVGYEAKNSLVIDPLNGVELAKREIANLSSGNKRTWQIHNQTYTPEIISSLILRKLKNDASAKLGTEVRKAVITVPAYFDAVAREATRNAGKLAGIEVVSLLNEPEAAAIAFTHNQLRSSETIFVYDLGGGTFDVTILNYDGKRCEVLATDGDHQLGGADFDLKILNYINNKALEDGIDIDTDIEELQRLKDAIETTKQALSTAQKKKIRVQKKQYELTREHYEQLIEDKMLETEITMNKVLEVARSKGINDWQDIGRVILVGGSTKTPAVRDLVARVTGKDPDISLNPDEAVALGAAIYAKIYDEIEAEVEQEQKSGKITTEQAAEKKIRLLEEKVTSVCSHSFGVISLNEKGIRENTILIHKNTKIPYEVEYDFGTSIANQKNARIQVVLGEIKDPDMCKELGEAILELGNNLPQYSPIRVHLKYSIEQLLEVSAEDLTSGNKIAATIQLRNQMSEEEMNRCQQSLSQLKMER